MRIFLLEDDPIMQLQFSNLLQAHGKVTVASNYEEAKSLLTSHFFEIAFLDINIGHEKYTGLNLLQQASKNAKLTYYLTSQDDEKTIRHALSQKVTGFFSKNSELGQLKREITCSLLEAKADTNQHYFFQKFPTHSSRLKSDLLQIISHPSLLNLNLFISGETGTGKTYLAKTLCQQLYPNLKFFNLNLSEIPSNLLESELFGHQAGSFTGADKNREGLLAEANGHILFLDEIGSIPLEVQVKLLKVLEEKQFRPIGSNQYQKSEFILICATCEDLKQKMEQGSFREDLYFRIAGHSIHLPSLRQRKQDIPLIIESWHAQSSRKMVLQESLIQSLTRRPWSGNTRELIQHLRKLSYLKSFPSSISEPPTLSDSPDESAIAIEISESIIEQEGLGRYIQKIEREIFQKYQKMHHYKVNQICRKLKLSKAVYYRLAK